MKKTTKLEKRLNQIRNLLVQDVVLGIPHFTAALC